MRSNDRPCPAAAIHGLQRARHLGIRELVDRRHAAAVLGADVPVAKALASEIGTAVLRAVLDELTLGEALARARRTLLAKRNPLGLAYTLYGSVDLALH
jgi:hypothetical protein